MYQCAGEDVTVLYVRTGGGKGAEEVGPAEVRERYGIDPELVPDFIALRGDPSDGLPGAKGVGPKTAAELLRAHGSLEAILDNAIRERRPTLRGALIEGREDLLDFKDIATLRDAGVERPTDRRDRLGRRRRGGARARDETARRAARGERRTERLASWSTRVVRQTAPRHRPQAQTIAQTPSSRTKPHCAAATASTARIAEPTRLSAR